ncbi:cytochrome c-type biogenesis protein CcmH [Parasedimentitalea maritima]|uniref:Cytochrome c-type biogenesis protein n=1 Tax=Parasedimentitalea maritima TaxID=2578117 RepID=A0A5R8YSJ9_9RHOB|nr:cytochrome c-type biogenesis protein [Zongyanglinia marina]KAE9631707.1 cytochrome C biogenesis protein CcdA [Zongyanglinia marina]TLP56431.1 cytochrome c-type biogenesis protein CcmH [Zongyanglinia marina]
MKHLKIVLTLLFILGLSTTVFVGTTAQAVEPDEVLEDPALEARAREMSKDLRCLVCRNESIDESNAELARDLRILLRERLVAGDSDAEAMDFIVDRFGEYVLLRPSANGSNWLLWAAGPMMLLLAVIMAGGYLRGRSNAPRRNDSGLSEAEQARLKELLDE